ncbi:MAG TPA: antibiotic biosynthesis monooxygenase [Pyrinomonadaceae bacterium]|nr:antibiotic biosynthesis monooxygenase [Pyrinomonadaceae bacterium]
MNKFAETPSPPYYAVIFTTVQSDARDGYDEMSERMLDLAQKEKGFLGIESARGEIGLSVTYWASLEDIARWKNHAEHKIAQAQGFEMWYKAFATRVAKVEVDSFFER